MFKNFFISAVRSLNRYRLFTFLNIFGLATGMACSILILMWVKDERSYDKFNKNADYIYRLISNVSGYEAAVTPPPVGTVIKQQIPAVTNITRVVPLTATVTIAGKKFNEKNILYADANFLQIFDYILLHGNKASVLTSPNGVVITEATAIKFFGTTNAIGKIVQTDNGYQGNYTVSGVLKNIPHNSHLQFDILLPISFYNISNGDDWGNFAAYSYVQLDRKFSASPSAIVALEKQIDDIHTRYDKSNTKSLFNLQRLTAIHLHSRLLLDVDFQGNNQYVNIFAIVAIFTLLIACINFMNLSTALGTQRAKEVGLRKTIGALRSQLITQFIGESLLVSILSMILGIGLAWLLLPLFNELASKNIHIDLLNIKTVIAMIVLSVVVGILSGSYPALLMSSFNPVKALKGFKIMGGERSYLRNGLVIFQFAVSVILIVSTIVVNYQLKFIRGMDIGFNKNNLLYLQIPQSDNQQASYQALKAMLQTSTGITGYTISDHLPTYLTTGTTDVKWSGKDLRQQIVFPHIGIDGNFVKTFGMHLLTGRTYDEHNKTDENNYLLNEKALRVMGMNATSAIGQQISSNGHLGTVIGVVRDFNFKPVQQPIEPLIIRHTTRAGYVVLRTSPENIQRTITNLKAVFQSLYPNYPFEYGFVDQDLNRLYVSEQRVGKLFNTFSVISIIISCLGLFGLATFATQKRLKEIGVRRVLGATAPGIVTMLAKDFIGLVTLSLLIAFPVAYWAMNQWLNSYVYRIQITWWMFALAGAMSIIIAILTISYQSIHASLTNPVKILRME
jgi:putative ABC transport system permease protein